jgi:alpha-galactosidase
MRIPIGIVVIALLVARSTAAATVVVAKRGDASVTHDADADTWAISAGGSVLTLATGRSIDFTVMQLSTSTGKQWALGSGSDSTVTTDGHSMPFGRRSAGFVYVDATAGVSGRGVRFDVTYDLPAANLRITRHYLVTSGSPTFETWSTFEPTSDRAPEVSNLNALTLTVPAGAIRSLRGLLGDSADVHADGQFTLQQTTLAVGAHLTLGSSRRSSEEAVPWIAVRGSPDEFFATLLWSGSWSLRAERTDAGLALTVGLTEMTTTIHQATETPHVLFGVVRGGRAQSSAALRTYVLRGLRKGRGLTPLVTYNTWYAQGVRVDEESVRGGILRSAALGAELFVLDAGWYIGADAGSPFNFDTGLGTWEVDPARFPNGLKPLRDYAHELGMKFGLWVEPERANLDTVNRPGLADESWLARAGASYGSEHTAQICLGTAAAQRWVLGKLTALIDSVQVDYLKWDNNVWVNCDRSGHSHGSSDGNFAHVNALYALLSTLRARYPELIIENVSGGGNRLDLGMLRYSDVAWMDDRTAPAVHVRHNLEGLAVVFPPAYLLSFVTDATEEPLHNSPDLPLYMRSRAAGVLGLSFRLSGLTDGDASALRAEMDLYKSVRGAQATAASTLLSDQAIDGAGPAWDVLQETADNGHQIVVWAYQSDPGVAKVNVKLSGLKAQTMYEVRSAEVGVLGIAKGADLIANGLDVFGSPTTSAHAIVLTAQP